jgi:hypothetical protein
LRFLLEAIIPFVSAANVSIRSTIGCALSYIRAISSRSATTATSVASASTASCICCLSVSRSSTSAGSCSCLIVSPVARPIGSCGAATTTHSLAGSRTASIYIGAVKASASA